MKLGRTDKLVKIIVLIIALLTITTFGVKRYIIPLLQDETHTKEIEDGENENIQDGLYEKMKNEKEDFTQYEENEKDSSIIYLQNRKYVILDGEIQKNLPDGLNENNLHTRQTVLIKDGYIVNEYSIVRVTYTLQSFSDIEKLETTNNNKIRVKNGDEIEDRFDPVMMSPSSYDVIAANHFHLEVTDQEEKTINLYYCIPDQYLDDVSKLTFYMNPNGVNVNYMPDTSDNKDMYVAEYNLGNILKRKEK
ncbi:MAG: hypothetical protein PHW47_06515 [Lachnospira sp.]|nr:hypothetical protein [Lachnospira sp.]